MVRLKEASRSWLVGAALPALALVLGAPPAAGAASSERFLRVEAPHLVRHGVPWVKVKTKRPLESFSARLNGRDVSKALLRLDGKPRTATLSPSEGLRRGRNLLTVVAGHDGVRDRDRVVILVRSRVLPAAGRDREVAPGHAVRLDGTRSIPGPSGKLSYRWRIVAKPRGSEARLRGARTARPRLLTDRRGTYRVDLQVSRRGGKAAASDQPSRPFASRDKLVVEATRTPPIGSPVTTLVEENGAYGIKLGDTIYKSPSDESIQILVFQASKLEFVEEKTVSMGIPADAMNAALCSLQGLYVIQVPPPISERFAEEYGPSIQRGEGPQCLELATLGSYQEGISAIGSGDWTTTNWAGPISGYLQRESAETNVSGTEEPVVSSWYRYVAGQFVSYDTQAPSPPANGNTIEVGGPNEIVDFANSKQLPNGVSGFHALALDAQTMAPLGAAAFATNGAAEAENATGIAELNEWLGRFSSQPFETRVILQSIGAPEAKATPNVQAWAQAAGKIGALGGNAHVFNTIKGSYAFYGGTEMGPDEVADGVDLSEAVTGKPAALGGVLARDRRYDFSPSLTDPGGNMDTRLMPIAFQAPQEWPHPDGSAGEQAAAGYLMAHRLGDTDLATVEELRQRYWDDGLFVKNIGNYNNLDCPSVPEPEELARGGFTREDFEAVCNEVQSELTWVGELADLLGTPGNDSYGEVQEVLVGDAGSEITHYIETKITEEIENYKPPEEEEEEFNILGFVSDIAWVAEEVFPVEDGINPAGLFASVEGLAAEIGTTPGGEVLPEPIKARANQAVGAFLDNAATTAMQFSKLTEILVSDYGKLSTVGKLIGPSGPESWKWKSEYGTNSFISGSVRWAYRQLLPVKYSAVILDPIPEAGDGPNTKPTAYQCPQVGGGEGIEQPFLHAPEQSYFDYYATPASPENWIIMADVGEQPPSPPSAELAAALQASPTSLYLPWLFEELPQMLFSNGKYCH